MKKLYLSIIVLVILIAVIFNSADNSSAVSTSSGTWQIVMSDNLDQLIIKINTETGKAFYIEGLLVEEKLCRTLQANPTKNILAWEPIYTRTKVKK